MFPEACSIATITPITKSGNKCFVNNWPTISLLPLIGKMMERLCTQLLNNHLINHNIVCEEQYGSRPEKSTSFAIFNYIKNITVEDINQRKIVGALYLDFAKAFNSINHQLLF